MPDHITIPDGYKVCKSGEHCAHSNGPVLPHTADYWYLNQNSRLCKECFKRRRRQNHAENRERDNTRAREYLRARPEQRRQYQRNRRFRIEHDTQHYSVKQLDLIYKGQRGNCWWCGKFVGLIFELDHRIPVDKGGPDDLGNIVITCPDCNRKKHDKLPGEFNGRLL